MLMYRRNTSDEYLGILTRMTMASCDSGDLSDRRSDPDSSGVAAVRVIKRFLDN